MALDSLPASQPAIWVIHLAGSFSDFIQGEIIPGVAVPVWGFGAPFQILMRQENKVTRTLPFGKVEMSSYLLTC